MLRNTIVAGVLGLLAASSVLAQTCPCGGGTRLTGPIAIARVLGGNTVCAVLGSEQWQEFHQRLGGGVGGGQLFEMGNVPNGELAGTWDTNNDSITYSYGTAGSGGVYSYAVCKDGANVNYCGLTVPGRNITNVVVVPGRSSCGFPSAAAPAAPQATARRVSPTSR
jgi:hypothetical protein